MPQGITLIDSNNNPVGGNTSPLVVGANGVRPTASFVRPLNATQYTGPSGTNPGDLVANHVTNTGVVPMTFSNCGQNGRGGKIYRARILTNNTTVTRTTNASFRLHIFSTAGITCANGDNATFSTDQAANYIGSMDITVDMPFTDGARGNGYATIDPFISFTSDTLYGLLEARSAYMPTSAEIFTISLEIDQN